MNAAIFHRRDGTGRRDSLNENPLRAAPPAVPTYHSKGRSDSLNQNSLRLLPSLRCKVSAAIGLCLLSRLGFTAEPSAADLELFEKRVRPVLVESCVECHGEKKQKGGLRLDSRAAALAGGELGAALVPGDAEKSLIVEAVRYTNEDLQMPPKKRLSATQVADLTEWVKRGAVWPGDAGTVVAKSEGEMIFTDAHKAHWAFQPSRKSAVPQPKNAAWCRTDIDRFILAKLEAVGLAPAPPADARTLLRRLSFDLTGLPPAPEEVEAFLKECGVRNSEFGITESNAANNSALRIPKSAIERFLASPHYGERWARHWLDVARYADSVGSEVDHAMANAWRYRDYVVGAFNDDKPFDQFAREQIAGDLLPKPGADALAATGFLLLGPKALADLDKPKLQADIVDEQVDTVGRAFMGLTMGCCRCHDHKFDPLPTADYYAMAGIFGSTRTMADMSKRVVTWNERPLALADRSRVEALAKRIDALKTQRDANGAAKPAKAALAAGKDFLVIEAEDFTRGNVRVESDQLGRGIGVVRTRMEYPDHIEYEFELPAAGEYQLELRYAAKESRPTELSLNGNLEAMDAAAEVTGDWKPDAQRWFVQGIYKMRAGKNLLAFHRDGPVPLFDKLLIGRVSAEPHSRHVPAAPAAKAAAPAKGVDKKKIDADITAAQRELEAIPTVMAPFDGPVADAPILIRGNPATPGAVVPRGFPRIVNVAATKPGAQQSGRMELAQWMTQPQHPLTARVIVNRVWLWHFGEGLMRSPDNFGLRGEKPSHPELLDWLATWFVENGWSLKKLHTLICTSAVYQQSSLAQPPAADPENVLLSHWPRPRLDAESLHDAMLAVSGQLDPALGGSLMTVLNRTYANGGNAPPDIARQMHYESPRRSLYLPIIRNALHDFFAAFDYPDPGMLTGHRASTTVAPQALFLMNSPFVKAQATAFAKRVMQAGPDDATRIRAAYEMAFGRLPSAAEVEAAAGYVARESPAEGTRGDSRATAWTRLCHALLASNEFLYVR